MISLLTHQLGTLPLDYTGGSASRPRYIWLALRIKLYNTNWQPILESSARWRLDQFNFHVYGYSRDDSRRNCLLAVIQTVSCGYI